MTNGWTGGQYSIFRAVLAIYLLGHFLPLSPPADLPQGVARGLLAVAAVERAFGIGLYDRAAALILCCLMAYLGSREPLHANLSILAVVWLLLLHTFLPSAPYGSWMGRGLESIRAEVGHAAVYLAAMWIWFALSYSYSGYSKLVSPSCGRRHRPGLLRRDARNAALVSGLDSATRDVDGTRPGIDVRPDGTGGAADGREAWGAMLLIHLSLLSFPQLHRSGGSEERGGAGDRRAAHAQGKREPIARRRGRSETPGSLIEQFEEHADPVWRRHGATSCDDCRWWPTFDFLKRPGECAPSAICRT